MRMMPLKFLRCPFCGDRLRAAGAKVKPPPGGLRDGVLRCDCCAYPVVQGIAYLRTGEAAEDAMKALGRGDRAEALRALLELDRSRWRVVRRRLLGGARTSFREALGMLCEDAESPYLLYRFSDPTFLRSRALVRALQRDLPPQGPVLDLCAGTGHLARAILQTGGGRPVVLADREFWKLWLARRFIVPDASAHAVCCDANQPLPFARGTFALACCSDAFHYIWSKRRLADEMVRAIGGQARGVVLLSHLHNLLSWNYSQGMPLKPAGYRALFEGSGLHVHLFAERSMPFDLPGTQVVDLWRNWSDQSLRDEPALELVASRSARVFRRHLLRTPPPRNPEINPLYQRNGRAGVLKLSFPSRDYEQEYAESVQYLPRTVRANHRVGAATLDLPDHYL